MDSTNATAAPSTEATIASLRAEVERLQFQARAGQMLAIALAERDAEMLALMRKDVTKAIPEDAIAAYERVAGKKATRVRRARAFARR